MDQKDQERLASEKARFAARMAEGSKVIDPIVRCTFQNIEDAPIPGKQSPPFEFSFQNPKGQILSFRISRTEEVKDTALRHGQTYELPLSVVNHLNSIKTPVYGQKHIPDPVTGVLRVVNYISNYRNRFALVPTDMSSFQVVDKDEKEKERRVGRPSKQSEQEKTNRELAALGNV